MYEDSENEPSKKNRICKETFHINKMPINEPKELIISTKIGIDVIVDLTLDLSEEFKSLIPAQEKSATKAHSMTKAQMQRREQVLDVDSFNILRMAPLMYEFILALSPVVQLKKDAINFFTWKDPQRTGLTALVVSLGILYANTSMLSVGALIFFILSKKIIPVILQVKPVKEDAKKIEVYKRNFIMARVSYFQLYC